MVCGGISTKGCTYLYRLDNGTLAAIRYQDPMHQHGFWVSLGVGQCLH